MSESPREVFDRAWGFRAETRSRAEADAAYHWFRLGWDSGQEPRAQVHTDGSVK